MEQTYEKKAMAAIKKYVKSEEDPIAGLIPKKANVDLKRNLAIKLDKLNNKTERAILELLSKSLMFIIECIEENFKQNNGK